MKYSSDIRSEILKELAEAAGLEPQPENSVTAQQFIDYMAEQGVVLDNTQAHRKLQKIAQKSERKYLVNGRMCPVYYLRDSQIT